jgi:type II secretory pathway predicted ATPase ExeA
MKLPFQDRRYYLKFGLDKDPFPRESRDTKVFLTHDMIHCLDQIKASVDCSEELVVVSSASGSGKTVLSRYLGFIKSAHWFVAHIGGHRDLDRETLAWEIIRQHFPERRFVREQAVYLLQEFLQLFARNGRTPVVIIDDAHKLPLETLKFVLEIAAFAQQGTHYRCVLFGGLNLDEKLSDPNLRNLKPARYHHFRIPSLSLQQTRKYLDYRLSLCGECSEDPFTDENVQLIFRESAGLPGDVHAPARRIMQEYSVAGGEQRMYLRSAVTASVCLLVFSAVYSAMNEDYLQKSELVIASRSSPSGIIPLELPGTGKPVESAGTDDSAARHAVTPPATGKNIESPVTGTDAGETGDAGIPGWLFGTAGRTTHRSVDRQTGPATAAMAGHLSMKLSDVIAD